MTTDESPVTERPVRTGGMAPLSRSPGLNRGGEGRGGKDAGGGEDKGGTLRHGYGRDRQLLLRRLARVEGQVRGIARMIERDEYCKDILQQTAALRAAVDAIAVLVLEDHIAVCLRTAVETGRAEEYTEEVMDVVRRTLGRPVRAGRTAAE